MNMREELIAEIDVESLRSNIRQFSQHIRPANIIGVVKADAYGHGAVPVAEVLLEEGVSVLAVAIVDEAVQLREAGISAPIFILGKIWPTQIEALFEYDLEVLIASRDDFDRLAAAAADQQRELNIHLKIDTGMGRLGFLYTEWQEDYQKIQSHPWLKLKGIMSHLATADDEDTSHIRRQADRFAAIKRQVLETEPANPPHFHLANSAATLFYPELGYDMVRLGLSMYGMPPAPDRTLPFTLHQLLTLKAKIAYIKQFPAGYPVGYGSTYRTEANSTILVCPGGYEDGIPRRYGNSGEVLIHGKRFPIVGNVSMDTFMVDAFTEEVQIGEEVVILGRQGEEFISIWEMSEALGVIPYEVTCGISQRVPRCYVDGDVKKTN